MHRNRAELCTVVELQASVGDATKAVRLLQDRVEYWREISGRRIDDLQHLGGRSLSLQGFLGLVEQACVLKCNYCLRSETLDQIDLIVGERPHFSAIHKDGANQRLILDHRNANRGPGSSQSR